ncbi:Hrt1 [Kluyveromyces lactis]|nr:Hrt1 [Kluyveromyces lactis]
MATDLGPIEAQSGKEGATETKPNFEITKWTAVAFWSWDIDVDNCAICRNHIMEPCVNCQQEATFNSEHECVAAWGECNHAFHLHCITQWIKSRNVCPLDNKPWKLARCGK